MTTEQRKRIRAFEKRLKTYVDRISRNTLLSIRGQALSGDLIGAEVGLARTLGEVPERCGSCSLFEGDCIICCHPPVVAAQTPPDWCPKRGRRC